MASHLKYTVEQLMREILNYGYEAGKLTPTVDTQDLYSRKGGPLQSFIRFQKSLPSYLAILESVPQSLARDILIKDGDWIKAALEEFLEPLTPELMAFDRVEETLSAAAQTAFELAQGGRKVFVSRVLERKLPLGEAVKLAQASLESCAIAYPDFNFDEALVELVVIELKISLNNG